MHELSLCRELMVLIDNALEGQTFTSIIAVNVQLGAFTCIDPRSLQFSFDAVKNDTIAENAQLVIHNVKPKGECPQCHQVQSMKERYESCSTCSYFPINVVDGDDMLLKSVEVD